MLSQTQIFPTIPEWPFVGCHSLFALSTLLSLIVTLLFLSDVDPEVLKSFFPRWLVNFDGRFPEFTIKSFGIFFEYFVLEVIFSQSALFSGI